MTRSDFVATSIAAIVELIGLPPHRVMQGLQRLIQPGLSEAAFPHPHDRLFCEKFFGEERKELFRGFQGILHKLALGGAAVFHHQPPFGSRVVEKLEQPVRAV